MEEEDKEESRHAEISKRDGEELEKSRNEAKLVKKTMWSVYCFQTWCVEKDLAIDFKSITKIELNQPPRQFYSTVKNGEGEPLVGLYARLNWYISDPLIS